MKQIKTLLNGPFSLESEDGIFFRLNNCNGETVGWIAGQPLAGLIHTLVNATCDEENE